MDIIRSLENRVATLEEEVYHVNGLIVQIDRLKQDSERKKVHLRVLYAAIISTALTILKPLLIKLLLQIQ